MPWRTFLGYINGYSERHQVIIPTEEKICRHIQRVSNDDQPLERGRGITAFVFLVITQSCL